MADLLRRWEGLTFGKLGQPEVGYFLIWLVFHAAAVGICIGAAITEPHIWWRWLMSGVFICVVTYGFYYAMLGLQRVFRAIDQRCGLSGDSETGDTKP